jgi:uncharacterized ferritin-like protein (DUF455 family)
VFGDEGGYGTGAAGPKTGDILAVILRDEIGHAAIGSRWCRFLYEQCDLPAPETFQSPLGQYTQRHRGLPLH